MSREERQAYCDKLEEEKGVSRIIPKCGAEDMG